MTTTVLECGNPALESLYPRIRRFLAQEAAECNMLGSAVHGYRTPDAPSFWIRDQSDMMRAFRYWEEDMTSLVSHFAETQTARGWIFDYFTTTPEKIPCERENWAKYVRVPVEADVEYRFVKAVYLAWQASGDDRWLREMLPCMEKALHYTLTDPWRWDARHRLVKRGYSIDTWDFDYTAGRHSWLNFQLDEHTFWGVMHGDNSGYYEAFLLLAAMYQALGKEASSRRWRAYAAGFRRRANRVCFNGTFYRHRVPLVPATIEGVDETAQLSLSNPMAINRGLATHPMAVSILREYMRRAGSTAAFAEWFSIDPPFPDGIFGDEKLIGGAYCNGGIMPLVGGELARAAFEHGFEEYGLRQLLRYEELSRNDTSFLWYFPDGSPASVETSTSPAASPADAWGSSAMMYALMEGLAGVVDTDRLFRRVRLSPRWAAAGVDTAHVRAAYGASGACCEYSYEHDARARLVHCRVTCPAEATLHLLLPRGTRARRVSVNGKPAAFRRVMVEESSYVDLPLRLRKPADVTIAY